MIGAPEVGLVLTLGLILAAEWPTTRLRWRALLWMLAIAAGAVTVMTALLRAGY